MRGTLLGSESTRRAGMREMREAAAIRRYKKEHPEQFRGRSKGGSVLWIFPRRSTRSHSHRRHDHRDEGDQDQGHDDDQADPGMAGADRTQAAGNRSLQRPRGHVGPAR